MSNQIISGILTEEDYEHVAVYMKKIIKIKEGFVDVFDDNLKNLFYSKKKYKIMSNLISCIDECKDYKIGKEIAKGSNARIYESEDNIIKMNDFFQFEDEEFEENFLEECITHILLYKLFELQVKEKIHNPFPEIISISFLDNKLICVMEKLDCTFDELLKKEKVDDLTCFTILRSICSLLKILQEKFNFVHRDLHNANIMLKKVDKYHLPYIIDLGMCCVTLNEDTYIVPNSYYGGYDATNCGKKFIDTGMFLLKISGHLNNFLPQIFMNFIHNILGEKLMQEKKDYFYGNISETYINLYPENIIKKIDQEEICKN